MSHQTNCKALICPVEKCLCIFYRNLELKIHVNEHLGCRCYYCSFCLERYLQEADAIAHTATCSSRVPGTSDPVREEFDARYPLLVVWSPGMELPMLKADGSGDAEMVVRKDPVQVWDCAKGSRQITYRPPGPRE